MEIVMNLYKDILKNLSNLTKKIIKYFVTFLVILTGYFIVIYIKYYYYDGPKFIKECTQNGTTLESCKSLYY